MRNLLLFVLCALLWSTAVAAQSAMTNATVVDMTKAGIADSIIISLINSRPGTYEIEPSDLIALKNAGVSNKVIAAVVAKANIAQSKNPQTRVPANVQTTGKIHGHVTNPTGAPQNDGSISLNNGRSEVATFIVDANGEYSGSAPPGTYSLIYRTSGMEKDKDADKIDNIKVVVGQDTEADDDMSREEYVKTLPEETRKQLEEIMKRHSTAAASQSNTPAGVDAVEKNASCPELEVSAIDDAAASGDLSTVKSLVGAHPGLVSCTTSGGWTPLHKAAASGRNQVVEFLLTNNADPNAETIDGSTPVQLAMRYVNIQTAELLRKYGGRGDIPSQLQTSYTQVQTASSPTQPQTPSLPQPSVKSKYPLQRAYSGTTLEAVYAAMVQAAGSTMTAAEPTACMVNFRFGREGPYRYDGKFTHSWSHSYTYVLVSAHCATQSDGSVLVVLSAQLDTNQFFQNSYRDKGLQQFWQNIDHLLSVK